MTTKIGDPIFVDILRSEGDTDDIVVQLLNPDGTVATVVGWTAILSVGISNDTPTAPPYTFNGVGATLGLVAINMNGFAVPIGSYKYDIRITDTVTGDTPARVYFKGGFKVTPRIN